MKTKQKFGKHWKTSSMTGFGLSAIGLAGIVIIVAQLAPAVVNGVAPSISTVGIALEATVALILLMSGFALMVVGSDPFEDASNEFRFDQDARDR